MSVNRLNVLMTVMIAFAFLSAELGNAVNGLPLFNRRRIFYMPLQKYCGNQLYRMWLIVCGPGNMLHDQRQPEGLDIDIPYDPNDPDLDLDKTFKYAPFIDYLFTNRSKRLRIMDRLLARERLTKKGLYNECCLEPCTITALSYYCEDPFLPPVI